MRMEAATALRQMPGFNPAQLDEMLRAKFGNPMLGIYGGHLLLLSAESNRALLREIVDNLQALVGDQHPDVMALRLTLEPDAAMRFRFPPMLRSSWDLVVAKASHPGSALVPPDSYAFKIGGHLYGSGAALAWRTPPHASESALGEQRVDWQALYDEIAAFKQASGSAHMKVILGAGDLLTLRNVARASVVAMMAGADFIKTSTGKEPTNATLPVGFVMTRAIREYAQETGMAVGFKPAGGIRTAKQSIEWLALMKEELGPSWMKSELFRFGASGLLNDIERQLEHQATVAELTDPSYMSKSIGLPYAALQDAAAALSKKLGVAASSWSFSAGALGGVAKRTVGDLARRIGLGV